MTQVTTSATYKTLVTADLPDFGLRDITFRLVAAFFNAAGEEVIDGTTYTMTLDAAGNDDGAFYLPTPDNTGDAGANWFVTLPSGYEDIVTVAYSGAAQAVSDLLAAGATTTDPDVITALVAGKQAKDLTATNGHLAVFLNGQTIAGTGAPGEMAYIDDAASDGTQYARQDGTWAAVAAAGGDVGDLTTTGLTAANMLRVAAAGGVEERTPAQVLSDIGAVGTASLSAAPSAAEPLKADGSGGILFGGKVSAGTTPTADDTLFNVNRSITGAINSHGYRDESTHAPGAGSTGYASFDAEYSMAGGQNYDHFAGYQNRPVFDGSGTIVKHRGFWSLPTHTGSGTLTSLQHVYIANVIPSGGGAIGTQYGLYIEPLTGGSTNYAVFTAASTPSYFGGLVQTGSNFRVDGLASFGNVAANTAYQVYTSCTLDATKVAANAVLATAPVNLSTGNSYGAFYSLSAGNNTLSSIGTNYLYGFTARTAIQATSANSAARYAYCMHAQFLATANTGYTATAIGAYGLLIDAPGFTGAGTLSFGLTAGIVINNQGTAKAPTSYGLKIENQSGSTNSYSLYVGTGKIYLGDIVDFRGTMGDSTKTVGTDAPADWVQVQIAGTTYYLPAYAA